LIEVRKRLLPWLAVLFGIARAPLAWAQNPGDPPPSAEPPSQALPLFVAIVFTMLILWIVCMPSRKQ
jgi:hypothetical protein